MLDLRDYQRAMADGVVVQVLERVLDMSTDRAEYVDNMGVLWTCNEGVWRPDWNDVNFLTTDLIEAEEEARWRATTCDVEMLTAATFTQLLNQMKHCPEGWVLIAADKSLDYEPRPAPDVLASSVTVNPSDRRKIFKANLQSRRDLGVLLRQCGYSFTKVVGTGAVWEKTTDRATGKSIAKIGPDGNPVVKSVSNPEWTAFVRNISLEQAKRLAHMCARPPFDQSTIAWGGWEGRDATTGKDKWQFLWLDGTDNTVADKSDRIAIIDPTQQYFTILRKKRLSMRNPPGNGQLPKDQNDRSEAVTRRFIMWAPESSGFDVTGWCYVPNYEDFKDGCMWDHLTRTVAKKRPQYARAIGARTAIT